MRTIALLFTTLILVSISASADEKNAESASNSKQNQPKLLWQAAAPILQAALECRGALPSPWDDSPEGAVLKPVITDGHDMLHSIFPPTDFRVFGLPVSEIEIHFSESCAQIDTYTAVISGETIPEIAKAAKINASTESNARHYGERKIGSRGFLRLEILALKTRALDSFATFLLAVKTKWSK